MWDIVDIYSSHYNLPPSLVGAIIQTESNWSHYAIRYEPLFKERLKVEYYAKINKISKDTERFLQACSIGVMQTMGVVARELLFEENLLLLTKPEISINLGCKKLHLLMRKYGNVNDAIAAYNAGSPRFLSNGNYENQEYVDKVKKNLSEISKMKR